MLIGNARKLREDDYAVAALNRYALVFVRWPIAEALAMDVVDREAVQVGLKRAAPRP